MLLNLILKYGMFQRASINYSENSEYARHKKINILKYDVTYTWKLKQLNLLKQNKILVARE